MKITFEQFEEILKNKNSEIKKSLPDAIKLCCEVVRSTVLDDMAKTARNQDVSYIRTKSGKVHHPSLPGNPPAPDTGNLRASVHYTVENEGENIVGIVGTDILYGKYLELGTSTIAPRPWLQPALRKNENKIKTIIQGAIK